MFRAELIKTDIGTFIVTVYEDDKVDHSYSYHEASDKAINAALTGAYKVFEDAQSKLVQAQERVTRARQIVAALLPLL